MTFSTAQYDAAVQKINSGMDKLSAKIDEVPRAANAAVDHWYVPGFIADAIKWLADKICELAKAFWEKVKEVLKGISAPVYFFKYALDWGDVKGIATGVEGDLTPEALSDAKSWKGLAAEAYHGIIGPQSGAAGKIGSISGSIATALVVSAVAGLAFYLAVGIIIVKVIAVIIAGIAAIGTLVLSWAGAGAVVADVTVSSALIGGAISALLAALGAQAQQMVALQNEAVDNSKFPGGKWPAPTAG